MSKHSALHHMLFLLSVAVVAVAPPSNAARATITNSTSTKPCCQSRCGNIQVPYPFGIGIGSNCSISSPWFDINCNNSFNPPKPYLAYTPFEVVSITESQIYVKNWRLQMAVACYSSEFNNKTEDSIISISYFSNSPYTLSGSNQITTVGCDDLATVQQLSNLNGTNSTSTACAPYCESREDSNGIGSCPGNGCCRTFISRDTEYLYLRVELYDMHSIWRRDQKLFRCSFAFVGVANSSDHITFRLSDLNDPKEFVNNSKFMVMEDITAYVKKDMRAILTSVQAVKISMNATIIHAQHMEFAPILRAISTLSTYAGTRGTNIVSSVGVSLGSGFGLLFLLLTCCRLCKFQKKIRNKKRKQKFFKRNGGLLLQQQISTDEDILQKTRLFTSKELEKATDRFNESRILGKGGQGTVYKGMLSDGKIVAIKKSMLVDEKQVDQFINEVVMLSKTIHRNVVKLLGCCLETQVPLLVYEFISNGTLFDRIHDESNEFPFLWNQRLKIGVEVAEALAYLHSSTSMPIYHRDIKSSNILLDEKYVAKVADFGTSMSFAVDQTHQTTLVKGTFGYLDPEYFQSSQFTEKSDVYSFGIVLVELLTGQRPISFDRSGEQRSLATRFLLCMEGENLETILDTQVLEQGNREELIAVAKLAQICLNLKGKKRPTMKEVAMELESVRMSQTLSTACETKYQVVQFHKSKSILMSDDDYTWTSTSENPISSSDTCPLKIHTI
ncbi:Wall-associated receptor kinase-like 8 [Abeliophyllum distichum]|uniref:Wall-associated receptor kinase-like 8 n=1 Tax=Abeliophyllum distichum TaxID=126358 RepID=A0ABD1VPD6_9LAMI